MIWTVIADTSVMLVESNFSDGVFKQEHPTLRVTSKANREIILKIDTIIVANYTPDENKMVYIDLTDFFATKPIGNIGSLIDITTPIAGGATIDYEIKGLRNPQYMEIPAALRSGYLSSSVSIVPPFRWLNPLFSLNDRVELYRFENVLPAGADVLRLAYHPTQGTINVTELDAQQLYSIEIPTNIYTNSVELQLRRGNYIIEHKVFARQSLICNRRYAAVEWQSRTGMIKRHTWEVRDVKDSTYEQVELAARFNAYRENKGYEETILLHLDGLTQYDYWYYSDIITSSDVRVALNEGDADFGEDTRVQVLTKSAEQPNANGLYELNIEIKYKRYGRV